jgi:hypothetical protein
MMSTAPESERGRTISVELHADGLPKEVQERLDLALKRTMLLELADLKVIPTARIQLKNPFDRPDLGDLFNPQTLGIWIDIPEDIVFDDIR